MATLRDVPANAKSPPRGSDIPLLEGYSRRLFLLLLTVSNSPFLVGQALVSTNASLMSNALKAKAPLMSVRRHMRGEKND